MRHRIKKNKIKSSEYSDSHLVREMIKNFIKKGTLTTTQKRAKVLRSYIEIAVNKAKQETNAAHNYLLKKFADKKTILHLKKDIAPVFRSRVGGYVRLTKLPQRISDGAFMTKIEWTQPVIFEKKKIEIKENSQKKVKQKAVSKAVKKS